MPANAIKIMSEQPRAARIAEGYKDEGMYGREKISPKEIASRLEPLIGLIASGEIALDDHAAKAIAAYVEEHHRKVGAPHGGSRKS